MTQVAAINDPDWATAQYDVQLGSIGYEARARYAFRESVNARAKWAFGFPHQQVHDYDRNKHFFASAGFKIVEQPEDAFRAELRAALRSADAGPNSLRVLVDITSGTRLRTAQTVAALKELQMPVDATFVYSLASFTPPPDPAPNKDAGVIAPEFGGWWPEPERGTAVIAGLGYEQDKAIGAAEALQAAEVWALIPISPVARFLEAVEHANKSLIEEVGAERLIKYDLSDPVSLTATIESLAAGISRNLNVVILPFGPKLFCLCAILAATRSPALSVWRVSAGTLETPVNRTPAGPIFNIKIELRDGTSKHEHGNRGETR